MKSTFQGDIIKLKLSEDLDFSTLEDKRKASGGDSPGGSHGGISASPKSLNSRRKGRKLTSGDNTEPPTDELDQVGFMDDPDLNLLFETSGKLTKDFLQRNPKVRTHYYLQLSLYLNEIELLIYIVLLIRIIWLITVITIF